MKIITLFIFIVFVSTSGFTQNNLERTDTKYFSFQINYWFNMHHFLWIEAFMNSKADSSLIEIKLSNTAKTKLDKALKGTSKNHDSAR